MNATFYMSDGLLEVTGTSRDQDEVVWSTYATDITDAAKKLAVQFGRYAAEIDIEVSDLPPVR